MSPSMFYSETAPCEESASWIAAHWVFRVDPGEGRLEHRIPLTGGAIVAVSARTPAILTGPRTKPFVTEVAGGEIYWGTHFWPWATTCVFGDADRLRETQLPLRIQGSPETADALEALAHQHHSESEAIARIDAEWARRTAGCDPPDELVVRGAVAILASGGRAPIRRIAGAVGLSPRQFRRRFRAAVGLSPKELARIQRVRATTVGVVREADRDWVDRALEHGFADQAHLARELRSFFGTRPTEIERHLRRIRHGRLVR